MANAFLEPTQAQQPSNYLSSIQSLSLRESGTSVVPAVISDNPAYSLLFSPLLIYGSVILFFAFFLGAIVFQLVNRILDFKKTITTFVVALMIASTPIAVRTALQATSLQTRASPDEAPKNVTVTQLSTKSFQITWEVVTEKIGMIRYGSTPLTAQTGRTVISNNGQKALKHRVVIDDLQQNIEYEYEILSGSNWYGDGGKPLKLKLPGQ